jgi:PAS domain S-box-containing protein
MAIVDLSGKWIKVNKSLCEMVGYSESEMSNLTFQDITHPDDLGIDLENVRRLLRKEIP